MLNRSLVVFFLCEVLYFSCPNKNMDISQQEQSLVSPILRKKIVSLGPPNRCSSAYDLTVVFLTSGLVLFILLRCPLAAEASVRTATRDSTRVGSVSPSVTVHGARERKTAAAGEISITVKDHLKLPWTNKEPSWNVHKNRNMWYRHLKLPWTKKSHHEMCIKTETCDIVTLNYPGQKKSHHECA